MKTYSFKQVSRSIWQVMSVILVGLVPLLMIWAQFEPLSENKSVWGEGGPGCFNENDNCKMIGSMSIVSIICTLTAFVLLCFHNFKKFSNKDTAKWVYGFLFFLGLTGCVCQIIASVYATEETELGKRERGYALILSCTIMLIVAYLSNPTIIDGFLTIAKNLQKTKKDMFKLSEDIQIDVFNPIEQQMQIDYLYD